MIDEIIDLLERLPKGLSGSERESLRAQLLRLMNAQSSNSNLYAPAEVGTDSDKLDGQHGSFYQDASNISAGTLSTDRYSAYGDLGAESKIGAGATQVAAGDHGHVYTLEDLRNVIESGEAVGDLLQIIDWIEITGGAESLYDSALLTVNGVGTYTLAYDKNKTNQWVTIGAPFWTTITFSRKRFITKIVFTADTGDWMWADYPKTWNIYGSNTGAFGGEETLMGSGSSAGPAITTTTFAAPRTGYRYYKITFPTNTNLRVNEIELYTQADEPKWANIAAASVGAVDAAAIHDNVSGEIAAVAEKTSLVDADVDLIEDSAATNAKKRVSWATRKSVLKTYFDTLYLLATSKGAASGVASLNASTLVVENPANATATPTASKIVISDANGTVDKWLTAGGWINLGLSATYVSATSMTITGDYTSFLKLGTKARFVNSTTKYGYVLSSSYSAPNTTVNFVPNTSYSLANAAITNVVFSYANPSDFPTWLVYNPTITYAGGTIDPTTFDFSQSIFCMDGAAVRVNFIGVLTVGSGNRTYTNITLPTNIASGVGNGSFTVDFNGLVSAANYLGSPNLIVVYTGGMTSNGYMWGSLTYQA